MSSTAKPSPDYSALGRGVLNEILGPAYIENKDKQKNSFNGVLHEYAEEVCFGRIWSRKGISHKQRSVINIAALVASNHLPQLRSHLEVGINNGLTAEEIKEILLQCAVYCGLPAATNAFKVAEEVLTARKLLD